MHKRSCHLSAQINFDESSHIVNIGHTVVTSEADYLVLISGNLTPQL